MLHIAILGAGHIAVQMADTINRMNQSGNHAVSLYAVAARDLERAQKFANTHGVQRAYGSYEEMLQDEQIQLVYVATPHSHHHQHVMMCLEHGKHVLCEKAFAANAKQAREMLQCARDKGLLLTEAIWTRYQPMREIISQVITSGVIGQPRMLTANLGYEISGKERIVEPTLAGGALLDVGIYPLNFAEMVFGAPDQVHAVATLSDKGVDLQDSITLTWNDGKMAVLNAGANCVSDRMGVIYGTSGYAIVENINNPQSISVYDAKYQLVKRYPCPAQLTGYEYEVMETAACIEAGDLECPSMPHQDTIHMMELMDEIRRQLGVRYPFEA